MYLIKQKPEDFIVKERSTVKPLKEGKYLYYSLKKREYTTVRAIQRIASFLRMPLKYIGFAGTKDKVAVTEQAISIKDLKANTRIKLEKMKIADIELKFLGNGDNPISLGDLEGNGFRIIVREADKIPKKLSRFINYYGDQRFSQNNVEIGKAIMKDDLKKAVELMKDPIVNSWLKKRKNDYIGAINLLPKKILMLYIHSVSASIWNRTVDKFIKGRDIESLENYKIPVVGFGVDYQSNKIEAIIKEILQEEGITERDFIVRKLPELSSEGDERLIFAAVEDLKIEKIRAMDYLVSFFLPKGCYATELIKQMFS